MQLDFGVIGLGVMGRNLALNMESKSVRVAVYDAWSDRVNQFRNETAGLKLRAYDDLNAFVQSLTSPRRILMMIKDGKPVDDMLDQLLPLLNPGDVVIDGGNTHFGDTARRSARMSAEGIHFVGMGVSGGEEGARFGPALMPGGPREAWDAVAPVLTVIAAVAEGEPCCTYIGPEGAGHFVKMVHNGIEYADMQLIAEGYALLREGGGFSLQEIAATFAEWNKGELDSYLMEITADILTRTDAETGKPMVDVILDAAGQKGTGKWTSQSALDLGVAAPTVAEAVFARCISAIKAERVAAGALFPAPEVVFPEDKAAYAEIVRQALLVGKIAAYAQGFVLYRTASDEYGWNLPLGAIAKIFRGGCIIRARFLNRIAAAFESDPKLANLMVAPDFRKALAEVLPAMRQAVSHAALRGVPVPALMSALAYVDSYRSPVLPANLIQAQRDYFGAHTFHRTDREGVFHHSWN